MGNEHDRMAELVGALSVATDLGAGLAAESGMRTAILAAKIGTIAGFGGPQKRDCYYAGLLRFIGCTGYAHEEALLNGGDDLAFVRSFADVDFGSPGQIASRTLQTLARTAGPVGRLTSIARFLGDPGGASKVSGAHCAAAVFLSKRLGMSTGVARALDQMYERWDGRGAPKALKGMAIDPVARVLHAAHVAEVFHRIGGPAGALQEIARRNGAHFDPQISELMLDAGAGLFSDLGGATVWEAFLAAEPAPTRTLRDADIDDIAEAFAIFADLKSPFMLGHSPAVARLATAAAASAGCNAHEQLVVHRAGMLHDIGRVAVANGIWDKPGPLNVMERERVEATSATTERILRRSDLLRQQAELAASAYERLDGTGFHRRLKGAALSQACRLLATADAYVAMTEPRAHRPAMTPETAARTLRAEATAGRFDGAAVEHVLDAAGHSTVRAPTPAGLSERETQVIALLARGLSNKQIARQFGLSPRTIQTHVQHIFQKTGIRTRAAAALFAVEHGLAAAPPSGG